MKNLCVLILPALLAGCSNLTTVGSRTVAPVSFVPERATFQIQSPTNYVASFFAKDLHKSQFETHEDYQTRIHALESNGSKVFLEVDPDLVHYVYNSEGQTLVVILPPELITGNDFTSTPLKQQPYSTSRFTVARTIRTLGTKTMQNAFGATADVTYMEEKTYELSILNFLELPLNARWKESDQSYSPVGIGLGMPIPAAQAQAVVESKSATLVLGVTIGDLHAAGHYTVPITPTFSSPVSCDEDIYEIPVHVTDIKIYNVETGYVLASWTGPTK